VPRLPVVTPELFERLVAFRRDLHRHPELAWQEERTARCIGARLEALGLAPRRAGGTGIIVDVPGASDGPRIALRADMDALPIHEETGLEFASVNEGVMHACGHDGHSTMLLGAAELLVRGPAPPLPVRLLWQPAEENGQGALALIEAGALEGAEQIFGGHVDRRYPAGHLIVTEGAVNASSDAFQIEIRGRGGHGARPHEAVDAVVVGSLLVTALQTIVSREVDPAHPSVVSVGTFHAGTVRNVIAASARLEGTIRAQEYAVRRHLHGAVERIARAIGRLHGAEVDVVIQSGMPAVINTTDMANVARAAAVQVVGEERVQPLHTANMGGEDFAWYLEHVAGAYVRFGGRVDGREGFPAHSSGFDFDEQALASGAAWFAGVAVLAGERLSKR
jgi:hippurate hydrolase